MIGELPLACSQHLPEAVTKLTSLSCDAPDREANLSMDQVWHAMRMASTLLLVSLNEFIEDLVEIVLDVDEAWVLLDHCPLPI